MNLQHVQVMFMQCHFVNPLEIKLDLKEQRKKEEEEEERRKERETNQVRQRYTHEKKIIVFTMHTCRKLRNLAKQRKALGSASSHLMFSGLLLLKKGIIKNELEEIKGIGKVTAKRLLKKFKSVKKVKAATEGELALEIGKSKPALVANYFKDNNGAK